MALIHMREMLEYAYRNGFAVGAFTVTDLESLTGIINAAEFCLAPVILNIDASHFDVQALEVVMPAIEAAAIGSSIPVAIHLSQSPDPDSVNRAIRLGCNSITVSISTTEQDADTIQKMTEMAHQCGIPCAITVDGQFNDGIRLNELQDYVEQSQVDFLNIGISNNITNNEAEMDLQNLGSLNKTLHMPLILTHSAGLNSEQLQRFINHGVAMVHFDTPASDLATLKHAIQQCGSSKQADAIKAECTPWATVEHLIIYNVSGLDAKETQAMMQEGKRVLSTIPGVRRIDIGQSVKEDAPYRYTWLVRFCHPAVIDSYREHPVHVSFADNLFRPVAGERISIDYQIL